MLNKVFNSIYNPSIDIKTHPYRNIYYDNEKNILEFSMNDDRVGRVITVRIEEKNNKYVANGTERYNLSMLNIKPYIRSATKEIKSDIEFWDWFYKFYNSLS